MADGILLAAQERAASLCALASRLQDSNTDAARGALHDACMTLAPFDGAARSKVSSLGGKSHATGIIEVACQAMVSTHQGLLLLRSGNVSAAVSKLRHAASPQQTILCILFRASARALGCELARA